MSALPSAAPHAFARAAGLFGLLGCCLVAPVAAQEPAPAPAEQSSAEAPAQKPKPRPKPKPKAAKPAPAPAASTPEPSHAESGLELRTNSSEGKAKQPEERPMLPAAKSEPPVPPPSETSQLAPSRAPFTGPAIACDPGKSVLYDGPKEVSLWVTRTGSVTVTNPLRPLTPDVTRVLQIVIGGKLATAYGADLNAVRRGGSPGMLESQLGGPIRWDAALGTLPDALDIVADSGATVAELHFKECGDAPAAKVLPVAKPKNEKARQAKKPAAPATIPAQAGAAPAAAPQRRMPQGAIAE